MECSAELCIRILGAEHFFYILEYLLLDMKMVYNTAEIVSTKKRPIQGTVYIRKLTMSFFQNNRLFSQFSGNSVTDQIEPVFLFHENKKSSTFLYCL